ncbi:MAG: ABC transporter permease [Bacteroidota bacterium]
MVKNYLKITLRSLWKSKQFVFINVLGMGISLACCIVAYLNWDYNANYDVQHVNADQIYRINFVREFQDRQTKYGLAPIPMGANIRQNIPEIESLVRYRGWGGNVRIEDDVFNMSFGFTDRDLLDVFTFPLKYGSKEELGQKGKIIISDEIAQKYFGDENAVGKPITQVLDSGTVEYTVTGVFEKMPMNSSFQFDALTAFETYLDIRKDIDENNWAYWNSVFLKIDDPSRINQITSQLQQYVAPQNEAREDFQVTRYYLDPFEGMAVRAEREDLQGHWFRNSLPSAAVVTPVIMSVLILLIACFNFTNTAIAMSGRRLKEIGIRKVLGGMKKQLVIQFFSENLVLCLLSAIVGLLVAELLVPTYNEMWAFLELDLNYLQNIEFFVFLFLVLLMTGVIAGLYPAFYISSFEPVSILKGKSKFGGTNIITKILLGAQYFISLIAVVFAVGFVKNADYQTTLDYGYKQNEVLYTYSNSREDEEAYRNVLSQLPEVEIVAGTQHHIFSSYYNDPIKHEELEIEVDIMNIGEDYIKAMGMTVVEGRDFAKDSETDRQESVIINQEFARTLKWKEPIGKKIVWRDTVALYVVGVVKDFYTSALWDPIEPMMMRYANPSGYRYTIVKTSSASINKVNEAMEKEWAQMFPNSLYDGEYLDSELKEALDVNNNIVKLFVFLGIVAVMLSASGLFTMVSLNIIKRLKEIGVRKVLGASIGNIARKLNTQFFIILGIGSLLGAILSYFMIDMLMSSIWAYYTSVGLLVLLGSIALLFALSGVTVGYKIFNAARMNPVNTLRNE